MVQRILISGNRAYPSMDDVVQYVAALPSDSVVLVSGTGVVARVATDAAKARGLAVERDMPDWNEGTRAGYTSNARLVQLADRVVVFRGGGSPITMYAIRAAVEAGKPTRVFSPNWAPYPVGLAGTEYPGAVAPSPKAPRSGKSPRDATVKTGDDVP